MFFCGFKGVWAKIVCGFYSRYFCGWYGTVCRAVKSSGFTHLICAAEEGIGHRRPGNSQPRGLECQPKAMRPSKWLGKAPKALKFVRIRMIKGRNINKKEVPKFGMRILQASHVGARNKCFQSANLCSKF